MKTLMTQTLNIRTNTKIKNSLEKYSKKLNISKSRITYDAISMYLELRLPQLLDLQEAILQADNNEFATEKEVDTFFKKLLKGK